MLVFAEITTRLHLASADERLLVVVAVRMIRKMTSVFINWTRAGWGSRGGPLSDEGRMVLARPNRLVVSSAVRAHSLSRPGGLTLGSHCAGCGGAAGEGTVCCL